VSAGGGAGHGRSIRSVSGPAVAAVDLALTPDRWRALGFTVGEDGESQVGATTVRLVGAAADGSPLLPAWELRGPGGAQPAAVDGLPTRWSAAPAATAAMRHANTATAVDHVVLRTPDTGRTFAALEATGMQLRRERTAGTGSRALRQGFFRHGEAIVEVVGPLQPAGDDPAALLGAAAGAVRDAVQPGRRIVTVHAEATGGLPLALMDA
jgi:hypothetical protein